MLLTSRPHPTARRRRGVTLLEVLAAIFIAGVGLLALLQLFPVTAIGLAQEIQDDRAAAFAIEAAAFSEDGIDLLSRTEDFLEASLANKFADPKVAAALRAEYEDLGVRAAELEADLVDLRPLAKTPKARKKYAACLSQIKAIRAASRKMVKLLSLLD
jgi:prepilin-type N-terminal cleavage/methylation domain-containing protein